MFYTAFEYRVTQIIGLLSPMTTYSALGLDQLRFGGAAGWKESDITIEDVLLMSLGNVDAVSSSVDDKYHRDL